MVTTIVLSIMGVMALAMIFLLLICIAGTFNNSKMDKD